MLPCTCGHRDLDHQTDDGSCHTCGCVAYVAEGTNCLPRTDDAEPAVPVAGTGRLPSRH